MSGARADDAVIVASLVAWLSAQGAADRPHSGRTLLAHLVGTYRLLRAAHQDSDVCHAGLFHSVYGTNAFRPITVAHTRRDEVRGLIGTRAESLAWAFAHLARPRALIAALHGAGLPDACGIDLDQRDHAVDALLAIECANLLEQGRLWQFAPLAEHAKKLGMVSDYGFRQNQPELERNVG